MPRTVRVLRILWQITKNEKNDGQVDKLKYVYRVVIRGKGMEDMSKEEMEEKHSYIFP